MRISVSRSSPFYISPAAYASIGIRIAHKKEEAATLCKGTEEWIRATREALPEVPGRIVFISTSELRVATDIERVKRAIELACKNRGIRFEEPGGLESVVDLRFRRFLGLFWPILGFIFEEYTKVDITPQKRAQNWFKRTQNSTEAEIVNSPKAKLRS